MVGGLKDDFELDAYYAKENAKENARRCLVACFQPTMSTAAVAEMATASDYGHIISAGFYVGVACMYNARGHADSATRDLPVIFAYPCAGLTAGLVSLSTYVILREYNCHALAHVTHGMLVICGWMYFFKGLRARHVKGSIPWRYFDL